MQLDTADATEYRFLHEMQPNWHMRKDGAKNHPRSRAYMPPEIQRSNLIGENWCLSIVAASSPICSCFNALLPQYSNARLDDLTVRKHSLPLHPLRTTPSARLNLKKRGNDTKVGTFRCGWRCLGLVLLLIGTYKITFAFFLFALNDQPPPALFVSYCFRPFSCFFILYMYILSLLFCAWDQ